LDETLPVKEENTVSLVQSIEGALESDGLVRVDPTNLSSILAQFN